MPPCNEMDTGLKVTRRESVPTSSRSWIARKFREPNLWGKANDGKDSI